MYLPAVYVVGAVLVEALVMVFIHIIYAIISAIIRRRVYPPLTPAGCRLRPSVPGFLVFFAVIVNNVLQSLRNSIQGLFTLPQRGWMRKNITNPTPGVLFADVCVHAGSLGQQVSCSLRYPHLEGFNYHGAC